MSDEEEPMTLGQLLGSILILLLGAGLVIGLILLFGYMTRITP